jgi:hypothetical protein
MSTKKVECIKGLGLAYQDEETSTMSRGDLYIVYELDVQPVPDELLACERTRQLLSNICKCTR